jgi:hypothetical protein
MKGTFTDTISVASSRRCNTPGCSRPARRCPRVEFSSRCDNCAQRWRRQGDALQRPVRKPEVKVLVKQVQRLVQHANREQVDQYLRDVASNLKEVVESPEAVEVWSKKGSALPWVHRWRKRAVNEIVRVLEDTDPVQSGLWIAALFLLRDQQPLRFRSDRAFTFQLVRLWRGQAGIAFGTWFNPETGKATGYYLDLPPKVTEAIYQFLVPAYARFVSRVITAFNKEQAQEATALDLSSTRRCVSSLCQNFIPLKRKSDALYCSRRCQNRECRRRRLARKSQ